MGYAAANRAAPMGPRVARKYLAGGSSNQRARLSRERQPLSKSMDPRPPGRPSHAPSSAAMRVTPSARSAAAASPSMTESGTRGERSQMREIATGSARSARQATSRNVSQSAPVSCALRRWASITQLACGRRLAVEACAQRCASMSG